VVLMGGARSRRHLKFPYTVHVYPTLGGSLNTLKRFFWYYYDLKRYGADIISAHATYPAGYTAVKLRKYTKVPVVITPHGNDIHMIPEIGHGLRLNPEFRDKIEYTVRNADMVTSISQSITDSLITAGCPYDKIKAVPNGIDIDRFTKEQDVNIRQWLEIPDESEILLSVGRYQPRKGQDVIVRSLPYILEQHPAARLVIAGKETEALKPLINELGVDGKVILTGLIQFPVMGSDSEDEYDYLAALYRASSVYISAGIGEGAEGLSLAVLDAMAAGVPVVATNISGNRDIVEHGKNGYLVEPQNEKDIARCCNAILADRQLSHSMSLAVQEQSLVYSWKSVAKTYISVFEEVLSP
jgi:phosphatidylinositol alpha-1,6-mannosyltransferase